MAADAYAVSLRVQGGHRLQDLLRRLIGLPRSPLNVERGSLCRRHRHLQNLRHRRCYPPHIEHTKIAMMGNARAHGKEGRTHLRILWREAVRASAAWNLSHQASADRRTEIGRAHV